MQIVHHANYVRYLELARVRMLEEHDAPYREYMALGLHFAVTRCEVSYQLAARFDDELQITCWLRWLRGASLGIGYTIKRDAQIVVCAETDHALVDGAGRPARIPQARRDALRSLLPPRSDSL